MPEFNKEQEAAIRHTKGPCLVLAGPGSGKTTVITHRTKRLIEEEGISPSNILVITFTKAAATQMQERFLGLMDGIPMPVTFGTFHAIFFKILKYAYHYRAENIIREDKKYELIRNVVEQMNLDISDEQEFCTNILNEISTVKGSMIDLKFYYSQNCGEEIFKEIFKRYQDGLMRANLIDFDDMLVMCYELLSQRPDILKIWQEKYRYILIDEFQDIDKVQYETVRLLAKPENNLFIVGDDDQSIYRFRGAKPEIMLNFEKDYSDCAKITLATNYRSGGRIVAAAGKLIRHNKKRFQKNIRTVKEDGIAPEILQFKTVYEESNYILKEIQDYIELGYHYKDIAVLYRTNTNPRPLVEKMMEYNLPFRIKDILPNIYEHFIAKDMIAYIHAALDFSGEGAMKRSDLLRIINKPKRYISRDVFRNPTVDLEELRRFYQDKGYVQERISKLAYDLKLLRNMNPYAALNYIRNSIGYEKYLEEYAEYRRMQPAELLEVMDELMEGAKPYQNFDAWFAHMVDYGEELKEQAKHKMEKRDGVEFSTMHSSKGLEYRVVFIIDANESITPHKRALLPEDLEEERRLFYVAMTRAKESLHIYYCNERFGKEAEPSRFVEEINDRMDELEPGMITVHRKYGRGTIQRISEGKLVIYFEQLKKELVFDGKTCLSRGILKILRR